MWLAEDIIIERNCRQNITDLSSVYEDVQFLNREIEGVAAILLSALFLYSTLNIHKVER